MSNKKHEKYKPNEKFDKKNDIVLLILNEMVQFTNEIQPACLPFEQIIRADVPKIGQTGLTAGWGVVKNSVFTSTILSCSQMLNVPFISEASQVVLNMLWPTHQL